MNEKCSNNPNNVYNLPNAYLFALEKVNTRQFDKKNCTTVSLENFFLGYFYNTLLPFIYFAAFGKNLKEIR